MVDLTKPLYQALSSIFDNKIVKFQDSKETIEECKIFIDNNVTIKGLASEVGYYLFSGTLYFYTSKKCNLHIGYFLEKTRHNSSFSNEEMIFLEKDDIFKISIEVVDFHFDAKNQDPLNKTKIIEVQYSNSN